MLSTWNKGGLKHARLGNEESPPIPLLEVSLSFSCAPPQESKMIPSDRETREASYRPVWRTRLEAELEMDQLGGGSVEIMRLSFWNGSNDPKRPRMLNATH